jgi:SAM-dependent methyltransferase
MKQPESATPTLARGIAGNRRSTEGGCQARSSWRRSRSGSCWICCVATELFPLADTRILDVGCGAGKPLLRFLQYGARPENLFGVDLLEDEINNARELARHLHFEVADARQLPFEDGTMDLVLAFTLFSAIQSPSIREDVA